MRYGILGLVLIIALFLSPTFAVASPVAPPSLVIAPRRPFDLSSSSASLNWAGYALAVTPGTVNSAEGSWIVPKVSPSKGATYVALWVGIDGYNDSTVEQTGILVESENGNVYYRAWYEFYPSSPVYAPSSDVVKPGDDISAKVIYLGNDEYETQLNDTTEGWHYYSPVTTVSGAKDSNAEWIVERPSTISGLTTLANFGTAYFGYDYTGISGTNYAEVNGKQYTIGAETTGSNPIAITMVSSTGQPLATPSGLSSDGTSFTVSYVTSTSTTSPGGHGHKRTLKDN